MVKVNHCWWVQCPCPAAIGVVLQLQVPGRLFKTDAAIAPQARSWGHSQEILRSSACGRFRAAGIQTGSSASLPGTLTKSHQVNSVEGHKVIHATVTEGDSAIDNLVLANLGAELIPPPSSQLVASHHIAASSLNSI